MDNMRRPLLSPASSSSAAYHNDNGDEDEYNNYDESLPTFTRSIPSVTTIAIPSPDSVQSSADSPDENLIADMSRSNSADRLKSGILPSDTYSFNYIMFYLLGITSMVPWNFFITAEDYWMYKFRNVTDDNSTIVPTNELTPIQAAFTSDISVSAAVPNTIFLIINACFGHKIPLNYRMIGSLIFMIVFFIISTVLVEVDTDHWQNSFFVFTLSSVIIMNIAAAILSGSLFGICGQFPSEYMTGLVSGQSLGGIFSALSEIVSITFGASAKLSALVYFMIGDFVLIISLILYVILSKTAYFRYFTIYKLKSLKKKLSNNQQQQQQQQEQRLLSDTISTSSASSPDLSAASTLTMTSSSNQLLQQQQLQQRHLSSSVEGLPSVIIPIKSLEPNFYTILKKIWVYGVAESFVFIVTLCIYPSVTVLIPSEYHGNGHPWNDVYFVPVVNFLVFNTGDYIGKVFAGMLEWPNNRPRLVATLTFMRIFFLPALLSFNTNPRHNLPVFIHSDYIFIVLMGFFAVSNGYFANISLISAPRIVHSYEREMAASMMAAFLGIGLAIGSICSLILVRIL